MKSIYIPLLIIVLLLPANLGLAAMSHASEHGHNSCPFDSGLTDCSRIQNPFEFVISHISAFTKFFSAAPVLLVLVSVLMFALFRIQQSYFLPQIHRLIHREKETKNFNTSVFKQQILFWSSLHENSPTLI